MHQRTRQKVKDLGVGGKDIELVIIKPRFLCGEAACARRTFTQVTDQLPFRARCTARLKEAAVEAVLDEGMPIWRTCARYQLGWATINTAVTADALTIPDPDMVPVRALGIDEHRFARAKWFKHPETAQWCRVEPWMSTFVDADNGNILGVVDGRSSANITRWLKQRSQAWLEPVQVVAIDPSSAFRNAVRQVPPAVEISVDHWHVVRLGNQMLTEVRQRVTREVLGRRGRKEDSVWAHRMLLLRAGDRLTDAGLHRLEQVLDDEDYEQVAAWAVKERLRALLAAKDIPAAQNARIDFEMAVAAADMAETDKLAATVAKWWNRDQSLRPHPSHQRQDRVGEHRDQADQAHRPRVPQPEELSITYPRHQRQADTPTPQDPHQQGLHAQR